MRDLGGRGDGTAGVSRRHSASRISLQVSPRAGVQMKERLALSGWWIFAGVLLVISGVLNIIYGIAAIGDSRIFTGNTVIILSNLHTLGWLMLILGVLEWVAAFSLWS